MSVDIPYPGAREPKLLRGVITNTPAHVGDQLLVQIPSYETDAAWSVVNWEPHGTRLPTAGTACLVATDEENGRWVVSWVGPWA